MTEAEVADALWQWLTDTLGMTVIHAYQGTREPAEPYVVLNMIQSGALHPHRRATDYVGGEDQSAEAPVRDWYWRFSLNAYGSDAQSIMRRIKTATEVRTVERRLRPLIVAETGRIADATEILNEEWRARAQMDIELRGLVRDALPIDTVMNAAVKANPI